MTRPFNCASCGAPGCHAELIPSRSTLAVEERPLGQQGLEVVVIYVATLAFRVSCPSCNANGVATVPVNIPEQNLTFEDDAS